MTHVPPRLLPAPHAPSDLADPAGLRDDIAGLGVSDDEVNEGLPLFVAAGT